MDSLIVLPLACNRRTTGMFWIEGFEPAGCSREKIQTLQVLGNCISLALEDSIERGEQEERDSVLRAALDAQEREREHIALDVHDGAIQLLASAFQHIQAARDGRRQDEKASRSALVKASGLLRETMYELRGLRDNLRPATLDRFGLIASLESDILDLRQGGWNAELVADPVKIAKARETSLYRIVHEALTNIKKHAGVCQVSVTLKRRGPWLSLEIWDQGRGFSLGTTAQPGKRRGFGLVSMRKRTELLGGKFEVESSLGEGTRVSVQVPIRRKGD
jgi:two-component system NarL family sensor kinase